MPGSLVITNKVAAGTRIAISRPGMQNFTGAIRQSVKVNFLPLHKMRINPYINTVRSTMQNNAFPVLGAANPRISERTKNRYKTMTIMFPKTEINLEPVFSFIMSSFYVQPYQHYNINIPR